MSSQLIIKHTDSKNKVVLQYALQRLVEIFAEVRAQSKDIVFDIDGTVIQNSPCGSQRIVIPMALAIFNWAIRNNIKVYFVTARPHFQENEQRTISELAGLKLVPYTELYMRPQRPSDVVSSETISQYKEAVRDSITRHSTILMSLGDQVSDLVNLSKSPFREVLENLDSSKAWYLLIGENNPQNCVKLKDEVPRSRHDIVMFEPLGYLSNSTALEKGFEVLQWLMEKRKARSRVRSKLPPAIVFDIDATVIYNHTKSVNKPERSHKVTVSYKIYRWAIDNGIKVFFVTARPDGDNRFFAEEDLEKSGFLKSEYSGLALRPLDEYDNAPGKAALSEYKWKERCRIARAHELLMSFGDSITDLIRVSPDSQPMTSMEVYVRELSDSRAYVLKLRRNMAKYNVKLKTER